MTSPTIVVKELKSGSVIAISEILTVDQSTTSDLEKLNAVLETLIDLAVASNGYLDSSSISIQSTGMCMNVMPC